MPNKKKLQILVPLLIAVVIFGIYIVKNTGENKGPQDVSRTALSQQTDDNDYDDDSFYASEIDMDKLTSYGYPIFINFGSPTCIWCVRMAPDLKKIHSEYADKVTVIYLDLEENPRSADNYPVNALPTQFFINSDGTPFTPSDSLKEEFQFSFYKESSARGALTGHIGALSESQMRKILEEMVDVQ